MSAPTARTRPGSRLAATLLAATALLAPATLAAPAHAAISTADRTDAAAGWLAGQLADGDHLTVSFSGQVFPDTGLTVDGILAFDAAGSAQTAAGKATAWVADNAKAYAAPSAGESYAGSYAKLLLLASAQGKDEHDFGGLDLVAGLQAREAASGRFSDESAFGDFSNGITQSLALLALHRAGAGPDAKAADFLESAQCSNGGFPEQFGQQTCAADVDTTGYAVQALLAVGRTTPAGKALDWLVSQQLASGGFSGNGAVNANTTGLAAQGLRAGGRDAAADKAVTFLLSLQRTCSATDPGAIWYAAPTPQDPKPGDPVRATTQAVPALAGVGLADVAAGGDAAAVTLPCASAPTPGPTPSTGVEGTKTGSTLPATGATTAPLLGLGGGLLLVGAALLVAARRRQPAS
jgi:LPXTG-motif cell wall-anchored protein